MQYERSLYYVLYRHLCSQHVIQRFWTHNHELYIHLQACLQEYYEPIVGQLRVPYTHNAVT